MLVQKLEATELMLEADIFESYDAFKWRIAQLTRAILRGEADQTVISEDLTAFRTRCMGGYDVVKILLDQWTFDDTSE